MDKQACCDGPAALPQNTASPIDWAQLQQALQTFTIPHITARAAANLRSSCKVFQQLIDQAPLECAWPVFKQHLPSKEGFAPMDSQAVMERLRCHAASIRSVLAASPSSTFSKQVCIALHPMIIVSIRQEAKMWHVNVACIHSLVP